VVASGLYPSACSPFEIRTDAFQLIRFNVARRTDDD
jgi:hypothetical protein